MSGRGLGAACVAVLAACGSSDRAPTSQVGTAAGRAVAAALAAAEGARAPHPCATLSPAPSSVQATIGSGAWAWTREGANLRATRPRLVIAAVAQARGAALPAGLRSKLAAARPDVVLALGGMGSDQADLEQALAALAVPEAVVVAVPGDSEAWPALTAAVEHLAASGTAIVDGGRVRIIDGGAAVIATLPGLADEAQLGAGAEGCLHDAEDVAATRRLLLDAGGERPLVLAGPRAPQGSAAWPTGNHDRVGGVHAGDPTLTATVTGVGLSLYLHGLAEAPTSAGEAPLAASAVVAAGSLDPGPRWDADGRPLGPAVTLAIVDGRGVRWRTLSADAW